MDILRTLLYKYPNAKFGLAGNDYANLTWLDPSPKPSLKELKTFYKEMIDAEIDPLSIPDWEALRSQLEQSVVFQKIYQLAKKDLVLQLPYSLMLHTIISSKEVEPLEFYLKDLIEELGDRIDAKEKEEIKAILRDCGFILKLI